MRKYYATIGLPHKVVVENETLWASSYKAAQAQFGYNHCRMQEGHWFYYAPTQPTWGFNETITTDIYYFQHEADAVFFKLLCG